MIINELKTFLCIADCGSFGKAAEKLYLSPTAVMKQMNFLEKHLGLTLMTRTNRGIHLTESGKSLYKDTKNLIAYSEKALANARKIESKEDCFLKIGTSMLNPCKTFMDLWYQVNNHFPQYKMQIVPFEDNHDGILFVLEQIGVKYDFIVGVCDSKEWLTRCNFLPLGTYKKCVAVSLTHRLAEKKRLKISDLYGETLMMVKRGDSPVNDRLRDDLERNHPQIQIEDAEQFYDIHVFNRCEQSENVLLNIECWRDVHPTLVTIPVDWDYTIPYGLLYPLNPSKEIREFLELLSEFLKP